MDPLTQGLLGGVAAQVTTGRRLPRSAWLIGVAAGMAADLDVFIRPASDPLGGITYHRHFTHALAFIPVGALVCALVFLPWPIFRGRRWSVFVAALAAYATHGLLDACTSYGTLLWWPFSDRRVAWDFIAIIDPVFTCTLLVGLIVSALLKRPRVAALALGLALGYMAVGALQHHRAADVQCRLAAERGHTIERGRVMPTLLNLVLWRSVYEAEGRLYADALRLPFLESPQVRHGSSQPRVTAADIQIGATRAPQWRVAFERFAWFADDYTAFHPDHPGVIGDMRYGMPPDSFHSLWGMPTPAAVESMPPRMISLRHGRREMWNTFWQMLTNSSGFSPAPGR